jgi:hypothetical protein
VRDLVGGEAFRRFHAQPEGHFPVAVLNAEQMARIGAATPVVKLSADTLAKQQREHPELSADEYASIAKAVDAGTVLQDTPKTLIFILEEDGYVTVIKATKTGQAVFVTSFRRLSRDQAKRDEELRRLRKKDGKGER